MAMRQRSILNSQRRADDDRASRFEWLATLWRISHSHLLLLYPRLPSISPRRGRCCALIRAVQWSAALDESILDSSWSSGKADEPTGNAQANGRLFPVPGRTVCNPCVRRSLNAGAYLLSNCLLVINSLPWLSQLHWRYPIESLHTVNDRICSIIKSTLPFNRSTIFNYLYCSVPFLPATRFLVNCQIISGKQRKIAKYYKKQENLLKDFSEMETMNEHGCLDQNAPTEVQIHYRETHLYTV